jgi:hypothetical protein
MPYKDPNDPRKLQGVYAWGKANPEKVKAAKRKYALKNADAVKERIRIWREKNKEKMELARKSWAERNPHNHLARTRKRQAAKIQRTPKWLTKDDFWLIEEAYSLAALRTKMFGFQWDVDHIVPLQGKKVSGLHVPDNIQVIPAKQNYQKGNSYEL